MKKKLTPLLTAMALLGAVTAASAGDSGRTVCVLRRRPVAINNPPPVTITVRPARIDSRPVYSGGGYGGWIPYPVLPPYKVPAIYGTINPRLHYVNPCIPNGYVGGLQNLPTNVVQIPRTFTRPAAAPAPKAPAAPARGAR